MKIKGQHSYLKMVKILGLFYQYLHQGAKKTKIPTIITPHMKGEAIWSGPLNLWQAMHNIYASQCRESIKVICRLSEGVQSLSTTWLMVHNQLRIAHLNPISDHLAILSSLWTQGLFLEWQVSPFWVSHLYI